MPHRLRSLVLALLGVLSMLAPAAALPSAALPAAAVAKDPASPLLRETIPLITVSGLKGNIRLVRTSSEHSIFVPVRSRTKLKSAVLHLSLTNSMALVDRRSGLTIRLNDRTIAQLPLKGDRPQATLDIPLPVDQLKPDYNKISFRVAQHYTEDNCEDPFAPELWTEIDTTASYLQYDSSRFPLTPRLADLNQIFSPRDPVKGSLKLVYPPSQGITDRVLQTGSVLAQGLALRYQYLPVAFQYAQAKPGTSGSSHFPGLDETPFVGGDSLLIGTRDELAPFLAPAITRKITGPFLAVYPLHTDASRIMVVVSGPQPKDVELAASTFAFMDSPFPPTAETLIETLNVPQWPDYAGRRNMLTQRRYSFEELGLKTQSLNGYIGEIGQLEFSVPPDLMPWENSKLILHLHFAHGAGLRTDSVLNVSLNEQFSQAILIDQQRGAVVDDYRIEIPMRSLQSGQNVLSFAPKFLPVEGGDCKPVMTDNLVMTLYQDSWLELPEVPHFVSMPNMNLLSRSGFPYTTKPDGQDTTLWPLSKDASTLSATWTLAGRLAQTTGLPLYNASASFTPDPSARNLLVIGPVSKLPARLREASPLGISADGSPLPSSLIPMLGKSLPRFAALPAVSDDADPSPPMAVLRSAWADQLVGMQFESPDAAQKTVTAFLAGSPSQLETGIRSLIRPEAWGAMRGSFVVWDWKTEQVSAHTVKPTYEVGEISVIARMSFLFGRYPWPTIAFFLGLALLFAYAVHLVLLRRHHLQRQGEAADARA